MFSVPFEWLSQSWDVPGKETNINVLKYFSGKIQFVSGSFTAKSDAFSGIEMSYLFGSVQHLAQTKGLGLDQSRTLKLFSTSTLDYKNPIIFAWL